MKISVLGIRSCSLLVGLIIVPFIAAACQSRMQSDQRIQSGGLGLSRTEWENLHGNAAGQDSGFVSYNDDRGRFVINFMNIAAGYIKRVYTDHAGIRLEEARNEVRTLIPDDAMLIRTYYVGARPVDLYSSVSLKTVFPSDDYWVNGEPGQFIVLYFSDHDVVDSFVLGLGNNP